MLRDLSTSLRLSLALVLGSAAALYPVLDSGTGFGGSGTAWADDDDEEEDEGDDDDDDKGDEESDEEEDEEEEDPDQPVLTAGGLYVLETYPQGEIQRPLTLSQGIQEMRAGIGFDISNKTAFETFGLSFDYRMGYQDNVELQAGFKGINNFKDLSGYAAFEGSIVYDLVDFRTGISFSSVEASVTTGDPPMTTTERQTNFGIPIGFPFRYAPKEQVAVTALETAFEIQFDGKPDATPSIGIVVQPAPIVAILVKAAVRVADFDFSDTSKLTIPATIAIQLSPTNKIDAGMDFTFNNLKPPEPTKFYDSRFLLFFGQIRL
jgi:hypothetical protein